MGIFLTPLGTGYSIILMLLAFFFVLRATKRIPWKAWQEPTAFSAWCASIIVLIFLWRMHIPVLPDFHLHLLGVALLALMFGRPLALIGAAIAVFAYTAEFEGTWRNMGANIILLAAIPTFLSNGILCATQRYLPQHMFVYLFGNGFFGAMVVQAGTGILALAAHSIMLPAEVIPSDAIAFMLLLAWGEASLVGFLVTIFAVYRPEWLFTFDDRMYLKGK
ncbi:MAG: energy-coupling factor ABC transporter permease [Pseudomonadota bacterium]